MDFRSSIHTAKARKNLPGYPLGSIHIGRLARHNDLVGQQLGTRLVKGALEVAVKAAQIVAALTVTVDAKNKRAEEFYKKYGFTNLVADPEKENEFPKAMRRKFKKCCAQILEDIDAPASNEASC